jgi:hypothetical protein
MLKQFMVNTEPKEAAHVKAQHQISVDPLFKY